MAFSINATFEGSRGALLILLMPLLLYELYRGEMDGMRRVDWVEIISNEPQCGDPTVPH